MRALALFLIRLYQRFLSPLLGQNCRFLPTCSEYAATVIHRFGFFKGSILAIKRIGKCHPWHEGGFDPAPEKSDG